MLYSEYSLKTHLQMRECVFKNLHSQLSSMLDSIVHDLCTAVRANFEQFCVSDSDFYFQMKTFLMLKLGKLLCNSDVMYFAAPIKI